ncbi:MAG: HxlR family transcriptional regulator [Clostridia bacterium]|jgi:DNA-binding HxlR family transcriptional regulator|nr:HxlR family transcriptional regulator [Clostridia bacterium]
MSNFHLCPKFECAFALLGKRWNGLIIRGLLEGPKRFSDISNMIPQLSDRILVQRFKELEAEGIIKRTVYPETPVRIEYELTDKGIALKPAMDEVQKWAETWVHEEYKE